MPKPKPTAHNRTRNQIEAEHERWIRDILADLVAGGHTAKTIAEELDTTERNVGRWLKEFGWCPTCGHAPTHDNGGTTA